MAGVWSTVCSSFVSLFLRWLRHACVHPVRAVPCCLCVLSVLRLGVYLASSSSLVLLSNLRFLSVRLPALQLQLTASRRLRRRFPPSITISSADAMRTSLQRKFSLRHDFSSFLALRPASAEEHLVPWRHHGICVESLNLVLRERHTHTQSPEGRDLQLRVAAGVNSSMAASLIGSSAASRPVQCSSYVGHKVLFSSTCLAV